MSPCVVLQQGRSCGGGHCVQLLHDAGSSACSGWGITDRANQHRHSSSAPTRARGSSGQALGATAVPAAVPQPPSHQAVLEGCRSWGSHSLNWSRKFSCEVGIPDLKENKCCISQSMRTQRGRNELKALLQRTRL